MLNRPETRVTILRNTLKCRRSVLLGFIIAECFLSSRSWARDAVWPLHAYLYYGSRWNRPREESYPLFLSALGWREKWSRELDVYLHVNLHRSWPFGTWNPSDGGVSSALPSKREKLIRCVSDVGPASATLAQRQTRSGWTCRVLWMCFWNGSLAQWPLCPSVSHGTSGYGPMREWSPFPRQCLVWSLRSPAIFAHLFWQAVWHSGPDRRGCHLRAGIRTSEHPHLSDSDSAQPTDNRWSIPLIWGDKSSGRDCHLINFERSGQLNTLAAIIQQWFIG